MEPKGEEGLLTWHSEKSVAAKRGHGFVMGQCSFSKAAKQQKWYLIQWEAQ